jgi:hypothetical protein
MGIFNWFGEQDHKVFDYRPRYYDKDKEALKQKFGSVDGSQDKETYVPGSYIKGSLRDGNYCRRRTTASKAQNIIGLVGLLLVIIVLVYIAKFYMLM